MSLILVRHGQASFGAAEYDQLSPLGERQSRLVGARLGGEHARARVFAGPRKRHLQTAQLLLEAARAAGADYTDAGIENDLDELPVRELVLAHGVGADLMATVVAAVRAWAAGSLQPPGVLTPVEFVARVEGVYHKFCRRGGETTILVTSGGPIAVALLRAQALGDIGEAISHGLGLANASITALGSELELLECDPVAHFAPAEITQI